MLIRAGAKEYAGKGLVGHSRGVTLDVYTSPWAVEEDMRAAVAMIPKVVTPETSNVVPLEAGEGSG